MSSPTQPRVGTRVGKRADRPIVHLHAHPRAARGSVTCRRQWRHPLPPPASGRLGGGGQKLPIEVSLPVGERFLAVGARSGAITGVHLTIRDKSGAIIGQADQPEKLSMPTFARGSASA